MNPNMGKPVVGNDHGNAASEAGEARYLDAGPGSGAVVDLTVRGGSEERKAALKEAYEAVPKRDRWEDNQDIVNLCCAAEDVVARLSFREISEAIYKLERDSDKPYTMLAVERLRVALKAME